MQPIRFNLEKRHEDSWLETVQEHSGKKLTDTTERLAVLSQVMYDWACPRKWVSEVYLNTSWRQGVNTRSQLVLNVILDKETEVGVVNEPKFLITALELLLETKVKVYFEEHGFYDVGEMWLLYSTCGDRVRRLSSALYLAYNLIEHMTVPAVITKGSTTKGIELVPGDDERVALLKRIRELVDIERMHD